jgi:hypothetical protein
MRQFQRRMRERERYFLTVEDESKKMREKRENE